MPRLSDDWEAFQAENPDSQPGSFDNETDDGEFSPSESWSPRNLAAIVNGTYRAPMPAVGARSDGVGLFYPGKFHAVGAESESGKSWLLLLACAQEIDKGGHVVYIDFEDDAVGVVTRLMALRTDFRRDPEIVLERFHYIRPEQALWSRSPYSEAIAEDATPNLVKLVRAIGPALVVFDGMTEALTMHGLNGNEAIDVTTWQNKVLRPVAASGPAVVVIDHVVKDREARGRYDTGSVHKLNGVDGASYSLVNVKPFGIGLAGCSDLYIRKDRHGQLRQKGLPGKDGLTRFARLTIESESETKVLASIDVPTENTGVFRPTGLMKKISDLLAQHEDGIDLGDLRALLKGDNKANAAAIALLKLEGFVEVTKGAHNASIHRLIRPFEEE